LKKIFIFLENLINNKSDYDYDDGNIFTVLEDYSCKKIEEIRQISSTIRVYFVLKSFDL